VSSLWGEQGRLMIRPATWRKGLQAALRLASPSQVKEEVHRVFEACGTLDGGIIACGEVGPAVLLANIRAMYEAFREYGTLSGQHEIPTGMIY
jgi:hypothetical protein